MKPKTFSDMKNVRPPQRHNDMAKKDNGKPVRISIEHYEKLRTEAFNQNIPIKTLLDEIIDSYYSSM